MSQIGSAVFWHPHTWKAQGARYWTGGGGEGEGGTGIYNFHSSNTQNPGTRSQGPPLSVVLANCSLARLQQEPRLTTPTLHRVLTLK